MALIASGVACGRDGGTSRAVDSCRNASSAPSRPSGLERKAPIKAERHSAAETQPWTCPAVVNAEFVD